MAAYFPKFLATYNSGGATPNMLDARKTLDFQGFPGIAYISSGGIHSCARSQAFLRPRAACGAFSRRGHSAR